MKKNNIYKLLLGILLVFDSCESNFDPQIFGSLIPGNFPSTEAEYTSYSMTCYTPFTTTWTYNIGSGGNQHGFYIPEGGVLRIFEAPSDAMAQWRTGWGGEWLRMSQANFSNCIYYWRGGVGAENLNHFQKLSEITRFTQILGTVENAPESVLSADKKKNLTGEIRLCRGLMMYYLLHIYGPLPVVLDPADVLNEERLQDMERPALQQMTEWITDDFEYAVENIANFYPEKGRYNKDYARVCLMRHCLNEGGYMPDYYQRAIDLYNELKDSGYSLFTQGANPYVDLFKNSNKFNSEIIMAVSCSENADGSNKSGNFNPLMMLAVPTDASKTDENGNPTPFFLQGPGWGQNFSVSPVYYDTYAPEDKRRDVIITDYWSNRGYRITSDNLGSNWDGYIINKFPIETATPFQGTDVPLARWADVLLMFAEAEVRKTSTAPSTEAVDAVNLVRQRAGLGGLSASQTANAMAFLDAILIERSHEFLYEGLRKIDLIRFNKYAQLTHRSKGITPTHQYMPLPNYAVDQAESYGKALTQTYEREGWHDDLNAVQ
ncbi:MAG: RagB/SusD family nutrient uptake outer membrane protein [Tannerellaceae bacterium]|jgi:hypothetical protein|nr:RagB/SusD family nutrient uptake outer membrane protein [Tannerellaceae bacterium]